MTALNKFRVAQIGGVALTVIMLILLREGTSNPVIFVLWGVLAIVGVGVVVTARRLDERSRLSPH